MHQPFMDAEWRRNLGVNSVIDLPVTGRTIYYLIHPVFWRALYATVLPV